MNGRVYDPTLGRFLSADPVIQFPDATQGLNRYSYVYNNPLSFTDPTGLFLGGVFKAIGKAFKAVFKAIGKLFKNPYVRLAIGIAAGFYGGAWFATALNYAGTQVAYHVVAGAAGGFIAGGIIGGNLESAFYGGLTGAAFGAIGGMNWGTTIKVFAHGLAGGTTARIQGGSFQSGMLSAGFVQWASPLVDRIAQGTQFLARAARVTASAVIGGTASAIGGGKFENGANTAAFLVTLRELPSLYEEYVGYEPDIRPGDAPVAKGPVQMPVKDANNVGTQQPVLDPNCTFCEGGTVSRAANQVPGINAVAGVHDTMQISLGTGFARTALNVPLMVPAATFTYSAFLGQPLQLLTNRQLIHLSLYNSFDHDDNRRHSYAAVAIGAR